MRESELLKKAADSGVTDGLGAVPLAKILPPRTTIGHTKEEGTQGKEENLEATKEVPAQPPSIGTIGPSDTAAPTPSVVNVSIGHLGVQGFTPTTEKVNIRNVKSDSDQEEEDLNQQQLLVSEQEGSEVEDILNERLVLTPQDQEDLL